jgi:hypothetical protein
MEFVVQLPFTDIRPFLDRGQTELLERPDWQHSSTWAPPSSARTAPFVRWLGPANRADGDEFGWCSAERLVRLPPPGLFPGPLRGFRIGWRTLGFNGHGSVRLEVAVSDVDRRPVYRDQPPSFEAMIRQLLATQFEVGLTRHGPLTPSSLVNIGPSAAKVVLSATTHIAPPIGYQASDSWLTAGAPMILVYYDVAESAMLPEDADELQVFVNHGIRCHYAALTFQATRIGVWYVALSRDSQQDAVTRLDLCLRHRHALRESLVGLCLDLQKFGKAVHEKRLLKWMDEGCSKLYDRNKLYGIYKQDLDELARVESRNVSTLEPHEIDAIMDRISGHSIRLRRNVERFRRNPQEAIERGMWVDIVKAALMGTSALAISAALLTSEVFLEHYAIGKSLPVLLPLKVIDCVLGAVATAAAVIALMLLWYGVRKRRKRLIPLVANRLNKLGWFWTIFLVPGLLVAFVLPG